MNRRESQRIDREAWKRIGLALFVIAAWVLYFVLCSQPAGAPFIYADY